MDNIPTATDYIRHKFPNHDGIFVLRNIEEFMIEFAKLHVKQALKEADEKAMVIPIDHEEISEGSFRPIWGVDSNSILNAYPLENIK